MPIRNEISTQNGAKVVVDLGGFDRIRRNFSPRLNQRVARRMEHEVRSLAEKKPVRLSRRIRELEREWDVDRAVMAIFSGVGLTALVLGLTWNRRWLGVLGAQLTFLGFHAIEGWCPPASLARRLGLRSRDEINAEKYALKTLRGDFNLSRHNGR